MKFYELKTGTLFEHKGVRYEKITTLIAVNITNGKQKFFKRSDIVATTVQPPTAPKKQANAAPNANTIKHALDAYHQKNLDILNQLGLPQPELNKVLQQLENAKGDFLSTLNIRP